MRRLLIASLAFLPVLLAFVLFALPARAQNRMTHSVTPVTTMTAGPGAMRSRESGVPRVSRTPTTTTVTNNVVTASQIEATLTSVATRLAANHNQPCAIAIPGSVDQMMIGRTATYRVECIRRERGHRRHGRRSLIVTPAEHAKLAAWVWIGSAYSTVQRMVTRGAGSTPLTAFWTNIQDHLQVVGVVTQILR